MKHPALRCSDILFLEPAMRDTMYQYIRDIKPLLPPFIRDNMVGFEHVGSMTFGNNQLRSDWDFNIAMKDWNDQFTARRIYYGNISGFRSKISDYLMVLYRKYGLKIDLGVVDCDTVKYNICVTLDDMKLHHRWSGYPEVFMADANGIVWEQEDRTVDLLTFDPLTDEIPPIANQHLKWNFMTHRWQRIVLSNGEPSRIVPYLDTKQGQAKWSEDEWADLVPEWKQVYGSRFQPYHREGDVLTQD